MIYNSVLFVTIPLLYNSVFNFLFVKKKKVSFVGYFSVFFVIHSFWKQNLYKFERYSDAGIFDVAAVYMK